MLVSDRETMAFRWRPRAVLDRFDASIKPLQPGHGLGLILAHFHEAFMAGL